MLTIARDWVWFLGILLLIMGFVTYATISTKVAKNKQTMTWLMKSWKKDSVKSITSSLLSILCGFLIGAFILIIVALIPSKTSISSKSVIEGIQLIFSGIFNTGRDAQEGYLTYGFNGLNIGNMLFRATPIILTGLSVGVAFKTGLFNIGAPGQYLMGTAVTFIIALSIPNTVLTPGTIWVFAFIGGILAGALWGCIPGLFKSLLNINEVITCIMLNWIAANVVTMMFDKNEGIFRHLLDPDGSKNLMFLFKTTHNNVATPKWGLDKLFAGSQVNAGIIIAIIIAIVIYIIMNKTTFGYQLKACGSNRHAAKYAGINEKSSIIISMAIAGGLAGAGAALYYLSGNTEFAWETYQTLPATGFNGIPVALLSSNHPIGIIFSAIFISLLDINGMQLKNLTPYNEHITSIITAVIVYFSAFSLFFKDVLRGNIKINFKDIFTRGKKKSIEFKEKEVSEIKVEGGHN